MISPSGYQPLSSENEKQLESTELSEVTTEENENEKRRKKLESGRKEAILHEPEVSMIQEPIFKNYGSNCCFGKLRFSAQF